MVLVHRRWWGLPVAVLCVAALFASRRSVHASQSGPPDTPGSSEILRLLDETFFFLARNHAEPPSMPLMAQSAVKAMLAVPPGPGRSADDAVAKRLVEHASQARTPQESVDVVKEAFTTLSAAQGQPANPLALVSIALKGLVTPLDAEIVQPGGANIGVELDALGDAAVVMAVSPDSPADKAGICTGDIIATVDGQPMQGLRPSVVTARLSGQAGSSVRVGARRDGRGIVESAVTRGEPATVSVRQAVMLDEHVGYVHVSAFGEDMNKQFGEALFTLKERGMTSLVLDLRGNPGGALDQPIRVADRFLKPKTMVVETRGQGPKVNNDYRAMGVEGTAYRELPIAVVVNRYTQSGAEILAAALQDDRRAMVVGSRTAGTTAVRQAFNLPDGNVLRITIARWLRPSERPVQHVGLTPDVVVQGPACPASGALGDDPQVAAAVKALGR